MDFSRVRPVALVIAGATMIVTPVALAAGRPAPARAPKSRTGMCTRWRIAGAWRSDQANDNSVTYRFAQKGTKLSGTATASAGTAAAAGFGTGTLAGSLVGDRVSYVVTWQRSTVDHLVHRGRYAAVVTAHALNGTSRDLTVDGPPVAFHADGQARCVSAGNEVRRPALPRTTSVG